jgi:hypothetical protein
VIGGAVVRSVVLQYRLHHECNSENGIAGSGHPAVASTSNVAAERRMKDLATPFTMVPGNVLYPLILRHGPSRITQTGYVWQKVALFGSAVGQLRAEKTRRIRSFGAYCLFSWQGCIFAGSACVRVLHAD